MSQEWTPFQLSFTSHYVTINSPNNEYENDYISLFTSHYVTINSGSGEPYNNASVIYIPLCNY